jgi:hypothetical protein
MAWGNRAIENTGRPEAGSSVDGIYVQHNKKIKFI